MSKITLSLADSFMRPLIDDRRVLHFAHDATQLSRLDAEPPSAMGTMWSTVILLRLASGAWHQWQRGGLSFRMRFQTAFRSVLRVYLLGWPMDMGFVFV